MESTYSKTGMPRLLLALFVMGALALMSSSAFAACGACPTKSSGGNESCPASVSSDSMIESESEAESVSESVDGNATAASGGAGPRILTLTITDDGIDRDAMSLEGGFYTVTVRNSTNLPRGIVMMGTDRCCTPYTRYTKVLSPGHSETFSWYFPEDRAVTIKDLTSCKHANMTCMVAGHGGLTSSITFH